MIKHNTPQLKKKDVCTHAHRYTYSFSGSTHRTGTFGEAKSRAWKTGIKQMLSIICYVVPFNFKCVNVTKIKLLKFNTI